MRDALSEHGFFGRVEIAGSKVGEWNQRAAHFAGLGDTVRANRGQAKDAARCLGTLNGDVLDFIKEGLLFTLKLCDLAAHAGICGARFLVFAAGAGLAPICFFDRCVDEERAAIAAKGSDFKLTAIAEGIQHHFEGAVALFKTDSGFLEGFGALNELRAGESVTGAKFLHPALIFIDLLLALSRKCAVRDKDEAGRGVKRPADNGGDRYGQD